MYQRWCKKDGFSAILYEFRRFCKISIHRFAGKNYWNLTVWTIFRNFTKKVKKWIYTGGVHPNDRFLMIFMLQTPVFLGLKLDFQVLKRFFEKTVKKHLQLQQYDFSKNDEKTWNFSNFWFFWNVLDHFTKIRKENDFLKMENTVLDELCGRQQCKFKIIDEQMIILPLKMLILMNKVS